MTDITAHNTSSPFTYLRTFQHSQLFDELNRQKLWDQNKLVNKLNHINFTDGHIFILFHNDTNNEQILIKAYPQPCLKDKLICQLEMQADLNDLQKSNPTYLMIEDGRNITLAAIEVISSVAHQLKVTLPETCYVMTKRRTKRYFCKDINCKLIQGDFNANGILIDFTPSGLGIKLTGNRSIKGFDESKSILINLVQNGVKLFSGLCHCIRNRTDSPDGRIVFAPLSTQMALFPKKEVRNIRQRIAPSCSIYFQHPFFQGSVKRDIFDISAAGFSVRDTVEEETLLPGMIIPKISISYADILKMDCSAQVVYRQEDSENNTVQCGLAIVDMDVHSYSKLNHILGTSLDNNARVSSDVNMDALWEFFFDTGFIYSEKYEHLHAHRAIFKETYRKLYQENTNIARHFVYEKNGKIFGHIAMVHAYEPSWVIHHFAARRMGNRLPGFMVLKQILQYINGYHRMASSGMDQVMTYYRPENKIMSRVFGGFTRQLQNPKGSSLDVFSYFLFEKNPPAEELPANWELREVVISDLGALKKFYENASGGLLLSALGLEIPLDSLKKSFETAGFKRDYHTYCLCYEGQQIAFFIVNQSDLGLNLSDLLNGIKIIILEPERLPWIKLQAAVNRLAAVYEEKKIPLLIYPTSYITSQNMAEEKQYTLWIVHTKSVGDDYMAYMNNLMRLK